VNKFEKADYSIVNGKVKLNKDYHHPWGVIEAGNKSDGYTVPRWLHWFHKPLEGELTPPIIHDHMLKVRHPYAHKAFRESLKFFRFGRVKRQLMFLAVVIYQRVKKPNHFKVK
tara:strand:+ start:138 stop:476 length:339 start_codon:yes stop_codon:yes gene_type:complete